MYEFNPRSPYHRRMWHYESDRPLSVAQLITLGSLDARTAALLWLLIERHSSLIVSGPTDPTPGIGKTTTLNALLGFLPAGSTMVYTLGMFEDYAFRDAVDPATTCVLANEVSDHLRIYMWSGVARKLLRLPRDGFAVATSCHADTVDDVLDMLLGDLRLTAEDVGRLGILVNIGLVGRVWPPRRRFLTVNFALPEVPAADGANDSTLDSAAESAAVNATARARRGSDGTRQPRRDSVRLLPLATWDEASDSFTPATAETLAALADTLGLAPDAMRAALERRVACLEELSQGRGVGVTALRQAVDDLATRERATAGPEHDMPDEPAEPAEPSEPSAPDDSPAG